jgi:hypothetical protein
VMVTAEAAVGLDNPVIVDKAIAPIVNWIERFVVKFIISEEKWGLFGQLNVAISIGLGCA